MMSRGHCWCSRAPGLQNQNTIWIQGAREGRRCGGCRWRGSAAHHVLQNSLRFRCRALATRTGGQSWFPGSAPQPALQKHAQARRGVPSHRGPGAASTAPMASASQRRHDPAAACPQQAGVLLCGAKDETRAVLAVPGLKISLRIYPTQLYLFLEI